MDDAALYNGKRLDLRQKMADVVAGMKSCDGFAGLVSIRRFRDGALDVSGIPGAQTLESFLARGGGDGAAAPPPPITRIAFHEPFLVCYSSGTTGIPKAIVHSVGGVLLNFCKEAYLHQDAGPGVVALQYTTTGWIMYLASLGPLLCGGRVVLYDGSPFRPDPAVLVRLAADLGVTRLGVSPRWMQELVKAGVSPREVADLSRLRTVTSTGMVLSDQLFEWFYDRGFPAHVQLANISGGTDIVRCHLLPPVSLFPSLAIYIYTYIWVCVCSVVGDPLIPGLFMLIRTCAAPHAVEQGRLLREREPAGPGVRGRHAGPVPRRRRRDVRLAAAAGGAGRGGPGRDARRARRHGRLPERAGLPLGRQDPARRRRLEIPLLLLREIRARRKLVCSSLSARTPSPTHSPTHSLTHRLTHPSIRPLPPLFRRARSKVGR